MKKFFRTMLIPKSFRERLLAYSLSLLLLEVAFLPLSTGDWKVFLILPLGYVVVGLFWLLGFLADKER